MEIAPRGLTALAIDGVRVQTQFQQKFFGGERRPLGTGSYVEAKPGWSAVKASVLSFGDELTEAYIYLDATDRELQSVRLTQGTRDAARTQEDRSYPFEFSMPWPEGMKSLTVRISATSVSGQEQEPVTMTLQREN